MARLKTRYRFGHNAVVHRFAFRRAAKVPRDPESPTQHGYSNCYGYEVNANSTLPAANTSLPLPGRPAVVNQPFGAGHAILIGFDPWYRAWTLEEERLVLNGVLYPTGSAISPS